MKHTYLKLSLLSLALPLFGLHAMPQISLNTKHSHQDTLVLLMAEGAVAQQQHPLFKDATVQQIIQQEKFSGKQGKKLEILYPALGYQRVLLLGAGDGNKLTD